MLSQGRYKVRTMDMGVQRSGRTHVTKALIKYGRLRMGAIYPSGKWHEIDPAPAQLVAAGIHMNIIPRTKSKDAPQNDNGLVFTRECEGKVGA
jgi:hypothetical protein